MKNSENVMYLTEAERQEALETLKKEIKQLEREKNKTKGENRKLTSLRQLKSALLFGRLVAPYVLSASIIMGIVSLMGSTPFVLDNEKKKLESRKTIDSYSNISYEETYDGFENTMGTISYFDKWGKNADNHYTREVKVYNTRKVTENTVTKLVADADADATSLEELLGNPVNVLYETKENLTEEEKMAGPYLEATIYSKFDDKYITVKESKLTNAITTTLAILLVADVEFLLWYARQKSSFDYEKCIEQIKEKYKLVDAEALEEKIRLKKTSYKSMANHF